MNATDEFASWCAGDGKMTVHVTQQPGDDFIEAVLRDVEIRNVRLAS